MAAKVTGVVPPPRKPRGQVLAESRGPEVKKSGGREPPWSDAVGRSGVLAAAQEESSGSVCSTESNEGHRSSLASFSAQIWGCQLAGSAPYFLVPASLPARLPSSTRSLPLCPPPLILELLSWSSADNTPVSIKVMGLSQWISLGLTITQDQESRSRVLPAWC